MANQHLTQARSAKNDEFYTQYHDIEKEVNAYIEYNPDTFRDKIILLPCNDSHWSNFTKFFAQNFERLGVKRLIGIGYSRSSSHTNQESGKGKILILDKDKTGDGRIDVNDLEWHYLEGDGDFRSEEITRLRDEADIIVTNPPFSLFREFLAWVVEADKKFLIIDNVNAITYKEVFPLILNNRIWLGDSIHSGDREFGVPDEYPLTAAGWRIDNKGNKYIRVKGVRWFTNLDHGRRHQPLPLMTMADNLKFSKHKEIKGKTAYDRYDNYDAINVPYTDAIPSDYEGVMGVPITFFDKYCPEQFEIVDANNYRNNPTVPIKPYGLIKDKEASITDIDGTSRITYPRLCIIRKKQ